ncbi:MAG: 4-alpha-glucanotransferase [Clostridiales bacterium]|nr:4-alpha-glucanotransferase [Clostridiales bacterium]
MGRAAGILMPVASLPGKYGIGCFGEEAYHFVDFLESAGQTYWQILPLGPLNHLPLAYDSPYQGFSAFAGNPFFISLDALLKEGVLTEEEIDEADFGNAPAHIDYEKLAKNRLPLLRKAYERSRIAEKEEYRRFIRDNAWWLDDYALFMACKEFFGGAEWPDWPEDIMRRWRFAIDYYNERLYFDVEFQKYMQFKFFEQWNALKSYANRKHIKIIGDIPIYVYFDSADVWAHPELFQLNTENRQTAVAGCPPDAFSADGQVWGTPLYRWEKHEQEGFSWWMSRLYMNFQQCDLLRIDHFRGLDEYFSIPAGENALAGHWEKGPGMAIFHQMWRTMGRKPVIVEDLGYMTESVRQMVRDTGFPNMKVLEFAFDPDDLGAANDHLPHNIPTHCVVYPGTHDNDPVNGWFASLDETRQQQVRTYFGAEDLADSHMHEVFVRAAMMSPAETCVIQLQDHLGLASEARINDPTHQDNNWFWRLSPGMLTESLSRQIFEITRRYGRLNWEAEGARQMLASKNNKPDDTVEA